MSRTVTLRVFRSDRLRVVCAGPPPPNPLPQGEGGSRQCWRASGAGRWWGGWEGKHLVEDVFYQVGVAAALPDDGVLQFTPQLVAGQDAEIAADVGDDGADRLAADFRGDLLRGGQVCEAGVGFAGGRARRLPRGRVALLGTQ